MEMIGFLSLENVDLSHGIQERRSMLVPTPETKPGEAKVRLSLSVRKTDSHD
jgi:hypothetical protein